MEHLPFVIDVPHARVCVLMVHGFLGSPHHFDMLLPLIPADWAVHSIQLDGHGGTLRDFMRTDRHKWEAQLAAEMAHVCRTYDRVVVVAHSMGCMLSANAAVQHGDPSKIAAMLFLGAALYPKCDPPIVHTAIRMINFTQDENDPCTAAARACCGVQVYKIPLWQLLGSAPRFLDLFAISRYTRRRIGAYDLPMIALQSWRDEVVGRRSIKPFLANPHAKGEFLMHSSHFYYSPEDLARICEVFADIVADERKNAQNVSVAH